MDALKLIAADSVKEQAPEFNVGDTIRIDVNIREGERVFPLHSPNVKNITVVRKGRVRRAKLYYLRDRVGKAAKVKSQVR